jgi:TolB-like protein/tetratricopeptide (TPR) repeat protein
VGVAAAGVLAATSILVNLARSGEPEVRLYAVAPLQNHTGDTTLSTLGAMVTAQVTQQLALNVGVDVIDLRRVASGDTTGSGATGQARDVGAGLVIAGDIYAKGDSIVVQMQLLNAVNGRVVHQFDPVVALRPSLAGIVERIRDAVGGAVATLGDSLYQPWSRAHSKPPSHAAFVEFIQALQIFSRQDARLMPDVLAHMRRATELDTTFIAAKIWMMEWVDDDVSLRAYRDSLAAAAARQRPSLSPFDRASLDRRLARNRGDWEGAYAASKRMLSAAPHTQDAQVQVVNAAMATRRYAEAIRVAEQVDHRSGWLSDHAQLVEWEIQAFHVLGDVPSAIAVWRRARLKDPEDYFLCLSGVRLHAALGLEATADSMISVCAALEGAPKHREEWEPAGIEFSVHGHAEAAARALGRMLDFYRAENRLARVSDVAARMGNWELAYQAATSLRMDSTNVEGRTRLAVAAAHVGDTATVKATLRLIENWGRQASRRGRDKALHAFIVLAQGDKGTAIDLLRQAVSEGVAPGYQAWYHRHELVPFHGDPRFEALIRGR